MVGEGELISQSVPQIHPRDDSPSEWEEARSPRSRRCTADLYVNVAAGPLELGPAQTGGVRPQDCLHHTTEESAIFSLFLKMSGIVKSAS